MLVVDDEVEIVEELCELLGMFGHITHGAHCVPEALELLGRGIDVTTIISDFRMPGPSGLDLLRSCRASASDSQRTCRFYLMTGQTDLTDAALQELAQGGASVIGKPVGPKTLLSLIAGDVGA
ncbi:response regulator [Sphingomonas glaciei]|uniref:Response regulator n=1 Tax=Sphingomonas glaciei TaxID=2938948 RepID=A0ABY5MW62_9SPHN|nr:response regulator [Sphingomonas glaciei]UUR08362.1 response regulator [Sphingomonas glaciei]